MTTETTEVQAPENKPGAPVVPATNTPATTQTPAPVEQSGEQVEVYEYAEIPDDPGLTMALKFVGNLGLKPEHPAIAAAMQGNFDFLKAHLATLGDKARGFEHYISLAQKSWDSHVAKEGEKQTKTQEVIFQAVGGQEQWAEIQTWAKANAEPEERAEINQMINAGGMQARAAALLLQSLHAKAAGTVVVPQNAVGQIPANGGSNVSTALSPADFQKELSALVAKVGTGALGNSPEYKSLQQRRAAFRG